MLDLIAEIRKRRMIFPSNYDLSIGFYQIIFIRKRLKMYLLAFPSILLSEFTYRWSETISVVGKFPVYHINSY